MKEVLFMSPAAHFKNFDFKLTFGRENSTGLIGQNLRGEFMRKIYAASGNLSTDS